MPTHTDPRATRRPSYIRSALEPYRGELLRPHRSGSSIADLRHWLHTEHRLAVAHSTVARWLAQATSHPLRAWFD